MASKPTDLNLRDWELCQLYLQEMRRKGAAAHEPWEFELETWSRQRGAVPRASTIRRLRLRFTDKS
jgi:hypothetical protein